GPVLEPGGVHDLTFETSYETLYNAGYSIKWYHASGWIGPTDGSYFKQFQTQGLVPDALFNSINSVSTLFGDGTPGGIGDPTNPTPASNPQLAFEEDCANGTLADVSFLGTGSSEHPPAIPAAGAQFLASKLEALAANEDLWNSTVFILNYDENDGFFDHVPPITPPQGTADEFTTLNSPGGTPGGGLNLGSGFRVPAIVISPWTVGGNVCSDPLDHTSVLRFLERVTGISEPNTSDWRGATFSDFTSAF